MNSTKKTSEKQFLLDVNALLALADPDHDQYPAIQTWFDQSKREFAICPLTEAGFVRISTGPSYPRHQTIERAIAILAEFASWPGYRYWPIADPWAVLAAPFLARLHGHQQVTDAYLLGLAVKEDGILVTFDKGIQYLAGADYTQHLLVL